MCVCVCVCLLTEAYCYTLRWEFIVYDVIVTDCYVNHMMLCVRVEDVMRYHYIKPRIVIVAMSVLARVIIADMFHSTSTTSTLILQI